MDYNRWDIHGLVLPEFGSEPRFEPELLWTWPKSSPKFKNHKNQTKFLVQNGKFERTITLLGNGSGSITMNWTWPGFKVQNFSWTGLRSSSEFEIFAQKPDRTGLRQHYRYRNTIWGLAFARKKWTCQGCLLYLQAGLFWCRVAHRQICCNREEQVDGGGQHVPWHYQADRINTLLIARQPSTLSIHPNYVNSSQMWASRTI